MNSVERRRRWAGVLFLAVSVLMAVWGHFFLPTTIAPLLFLLFWSVCFCFTLTTILIAFADLHALLQRTRKEKRVLLEETLHEIEREVRQATSRRRA